MKTYVPNYHLYAVTSHTRTGQVQVSVAQHVDYAKGGPRHPATISAQSLLEASKQF